MRSVFTRSRFTGFGIACFLLMPGSVACRATAPPSVISDLSAPFLFAYGTWEKRVRIENGHALISGAGVTPRGGAGANVNLDLSEAAQYTPVLRVQVGPKNKMAGLRLLLRDTDGRIGTWEFVLPKTSAGVVLLTPKDGAALDNPNTTEKNGKPDLKRIMQWQLSGDWGSDEAADVEVHAIAVALPDSAVKEARAVAEKKATEERENAKREAEALHARFGKRTALSPVVERVFVAAPDLLALDIRSGSITKSNLTPYTPQPGDTRKTDGDVVKLVRGGQEIGWLIGPKRDGLVTFEKFEGDPLLDDLTNAPSSYSIRTSANAVVHPAAVYRKSKPLDWAQPTHEFVMRHTVYLKMPAPLVPGTVYMVSLGDINVQKPESAFTFDPSRTRSEAVHVSQIGYRPDDALKRAYFSLWAGTGGAYTLPANTAFEVVNDATGASVFSGTVQLAKDANAPEKLQRSDNFTKTAVYTMDFSALQAPGRYRVVVRGVGSSYPFTIGANVWEQAWKIQMRGLFNNRSGMELGPPYTAFRKPRDFHPADGTNVFQSTLSVLDGKGEFELAKFATPVPVRNAWGGYHDAGDWNPRRATHLRVTLAQLEVADLFPAYVKGVSWNIPKDTPAPDVLNEALWEIDCFRRMQSTNGGIPYEIETAGDPIEGEVSWKQSMTAFVTVPDRWSSYIYATAAARVAKLLAPYSPDRAKQYRESALRAMNWAEAEWEKAKSAGTLDKTRWEVKDDRNLAAVALLDLTGDKKWHDVFLQDTVLKPNETVNLFAWGTQVQRDQAFAYARIAPAFADAALQKSARLSLVAEAQKALDYAQGNPWSLTSSDTGKPLFLGFFSTAHGAVELVRAHYLTNERKYLTAAVAACQFQAGANPNNMTYTTGLGANPPRNPLHLDSRRTGQPAPEGLTVYGNFDFVGWPNMDWALWPLKYYLNAACRPAASEWPIPEAYFDIFLYPAINEFTVDVWAPNVLVWGYLAARK